MNYRLSSPLPSGVSGLIERQPAPLRITEYFRVGMRPEQLFAELGDMEGITRFFPLIYHATVAHHAGCAGEGSQRVCSIHGMGKVNERIVWWSRPEGYAYQASGIMVPFRNHLGIILITPAGDGGSMLEWRHYFETRYGPLGWIFPVMMRLLMRRAVRNIARLAGVSSSAVSAKT